MLYAFCSFLLVASMFAFIESVVCFWAQHEWKLTDKVFYWLHSANEHSADICGTLSRVNRFRVVAMLCGSRDTFLLEVTRFPKVLSVLSFRKLLSQNFKVFLPNWIFQWHFRPSLEAFSEVSASTLRKACFKVPKLVLSSLKVSQAASLQFNDSNIENNS